MQWQGEWVDPSDLEGPYPAAKWPAWLEPYAAAYDLYRDRRTNGAVIRCLTCDHCLTLPVYPTGREKATGRKWLATHWLEHAEAGVAVLLEGEGDGEPASD